MLTANDITAPKNSPASIDTPAAAEKRRKLNILRTQLENDRATFLAHWRAIAEVVRPRRPRFEVTDVNRGDRRNQNIIDSTATFASRVLASGMMSGVTSPARHWFRLKAKDPKLDALATVRKWLDDVTNLMRDVFNGSNLYKVLPIIYGDMGDFATGAMLIEEDFDNVVRFLALPIGSYSISVNERGKVDTYMRTYMESVRNLVELYGYDSPQSREINWDKFSQSIKTYYTEGQMETRLQVVHVIRPNPDYDPKKKHPKYKKYESLTYEQGTTQNASGDLRGGVGFGIDDGKYLKESGYDYFPVLCPRWSVTGEDSWGTDCPGMMALGDIKALQVLQKLKGNAVEKSVKPPMVGPASLKNARISHIPGDISFATERDGQKGLRTMYEMKFDIPAVLEDIQDTRKRINEAYFKTLFLMITEDERTQPPTAEEIIERRSEKMIALGPVLEQLNQDLFDDLIDITFMIMLRQGRIPQAPAQLTRGGLGVEYVSVMAQAQKTMGLGALERLEGFTSRMASETQDPTVLDKLNKDNLIDEYATALGVSTKIIRTEEEVTQIRNARAKAQQQQQQAQMAEQASKAAKNLSDTNLDGNNGLSKMLELSQAGNPLPN